MLMTSLLLGSCGRPDSAAPASQAYPIETPTPTPTPTLSPLNATKQADDERFEQELQTAAARPTPEILSPLPTNEPGIIVTGLKTDCDTLDYTNIIRETNCWLDIVNNEYLFFIAGADRDNPNQGMVGFYMVSIDETEESDAFVFSTLTEHGAVTIIAANPPRFTLEAADGTPFVFNVETRQWEEPPYPGPAAPRTGLSPGAAQEKPYLQHQNNP
jgi:hypothetical protein